MYVLGSSSPPPLVRMLWQAASTRGRGGLPTMTSMPGWGVLQSRRFSTKHICRSLCSHDPAHAWSVGCLPGWLGCIQVMSPPPGYSPRCILGARYCVCPIMCPGVTTSDHSLRRERCRLPCWQIAILTTGTAACLHTDRWSCCGCARCQRELAKSGHGGPQAIRFPRGTSFAVIFKVTYTGRLCEQDPLLAVLGVGWRRARIRNRLRRLHRRMVAQAPPRWRCVLGLQRGL